MKQTKFLLALLMISVTHDSMATAPINETQPLLVEEQKLDTMLNLNRNRKALKKDWKQLTESQIKRLASKAADRGKNSKKLNETLHDIFSSGCCSGSKLPKAAEDFLDEVARIQAERSKTPPPSDLALHPVFVFNRADGVATVSSSSSNLEQVSTPQTQNRPRSRSVSFADFQRSLSPAPIVSQQQSTNSDFVTQDQVEKAITATSEKFLAEIQRVRSESQGIKEALQEQVDTLTQRLAHEEAIRTKNQKSDKAFKTLTAGITDYLLEKAKENPEDQILLDSKISARRAKTESKAPNINQAD